MSNMSSISMLESRLPPGFRFHPRDEELVCDYLMRKVTHSDSPLMVDVDLNKCEPWDIPETACVGGKEWYFYTQRDRKYATGLRTNRATACGYWKATGKDRAIVGKGKLLVGMRKTLVFYQGRAPKGRKTEWVMHEFRLEGSLAPPSNPSTKEDWVLCRVFYKSKEAVAANKPSMGSCYDDTSSSNLPPLMDSYISFDQTRTHIDNYDEQVPCFSIFSHNQITNPTFFSHMEPNLLPTKQARSTSTTMGGIPNSTSYSDPNNSISYDSKVIEAVLNQLTKMESNSKESPSLGEGSSESYLTEVGMPNLWNNYSS